MVRLLALAEDNRASLEQRETAIRQLARLNEDAGGSCWLAALIGLMEQPKLQPTVISSLVSMRVPELDGLLRDHLQKSSQPLAKSMKRWPSSR